MIRIMASVLIAALFPLAAATRAQEQPPANAASAGAAAPEAPAAKEQTPSAMRESPSLTAGVRIITRPQEANTSKNPSEAPSATQAAGPADDTPADRYRFERLGDRFVRLDNQSGEIAICTQAQSGWDCRGVPEHSSALAGEIAQLQSAIDDLKALRKQVGDLSGLRADVDSLKQLPRQIDDLRQSAAGARKDLRADLESLRQRGADARDVERLRKDVDDLKQMRGEVAALHDLRSAVDELKNRVASLSAPPRAAKAADEQEKAPRPPETVPPAHDGATHLSPRESIDRAAAFISDAWRRLVEMISHLQKEAMRRS
ncbi:MAG TPA: hypothetical protein VFL51_17030 [Pseudolabrys sp.]|nr:hypothetical protein [Pseudolabrys sp.]